MYKYSFLLQSDWYHCVCAPCFDSCSHTWAHINKGGSNTSLELQLLQRSQHWLVICLFFVFFLIRVELTHNFNSPFSSSIILWFIQTSSTAPALNYILPLDSALKTRCLAAETLQWELIRFGLSDLDSERACCRRRRMSLRTTRFLWFCVIFASDEMSITPAGFRAAYPCVALLWFNTFQE